jgi:hypothetical protein
MGSKSVFVEFLGLPAVGKSTLCRRVAEFFSQHGIPHDNTTYMLTHEASRMKRIFTKSLYVMNGLFLNPRYVARSVSAILATKQRSSTDALKSLFNWLYISSLMQGREDSPGVHLSDQGMFQALWSISLSGTKVDSLAHMTQALAARISSPVLVIIVESSLATIENRLRSRQGHLSRIDRWIEQDEDLLKQAVLLLDDVKAILQRASEDCGHVHLLSIRNDADNSLDESTRVITDYIARFFHQPAVASLDVVSCKERLIRRDEST